MAASPHRAKWLPPFQELSRCRKSLAQRKDEKRTEREGAQGKKRRKGERETSRRRATATAAAAAVGRKFKIEYLASNFHRSSKNRTVSYLAGGPTLALFSSRPLLFFLHPPQRGKKRRKEKREEGSRGYGIGYAPTWKYSEYAHVHTIHTYTHSLMHISKRRIERHE